MSANIKDLYLLLQDRKTNFFVCFPTNNSTRGLVSFWFLNPYIKKERDRYLALKHIYTSFKNYAQVAWALLACQIEEKVIYNFCTTPRYNFTDLMCYVSVCVCHLFGFAGLASWSIWPLGGLANLETQLGMCRNQHSYLITVLFLD